MKKKKVWNIKITTDKWEFGKELLNVQIPKGYEAVGIKQEKKQVLILLKPIPSRRN